LRLTSLFNHLPRAQAATLVMTCVTIVAWTLGGEVLASRLGAATLQAHVLLVAETCARSFFGPASRSRSFVADPRAPHVRRERRASRDASAFLVLDVWLLCFAALHTASLCGAVRFADPNFATSLAVSWPLAICNWIGRLASETRVHIFDDVAVAVARKETTAMRRATRARRLGGSPAPKGKGLSQSPRSASAIAHTRTRRDGYTADCLSIHRDVQD
jgi:hypothetical protein